jgi:hypothetical protein
MKLNPFIAAAIGVSALISITVISLGEDPPDKYPVRVKTAQEAERLPIGTRVAVECTTCKTLIDTMADSKKAFLSWYDAGQTHKCPNCDGKLTFKSSNATGSRYTHTCTHCGARSAFVCAEHGQHSKN